ncbi:hypothetical protein FNJ67_17715 [Escherichia coli]|nr:hypothetical protein FNJ67_17715 [Escherichia coli]
MQTMLLCMVFVETYICFSRFSLVAYVPAPSILLIDINIRLLPFCFLLLFCIAASRVFYYGFVKYYRRYSLEVLMAFAVLQHDKKTSAISS